MQTDSTKLVTPSQLAERTGVPAGTLRVWSARHGFPAGERAAGGRHHRYTEADVEAVRAIQRLRGDGMSLRAAITLATAATAAPESSIYASLRRSRPDLSPLVLGKQAVLHLSRAIEDEHCARAGSGLLLGSFQRERHYRASQRRWRELSRTVQCAVALADFDELRESEGGVTEVPLPPEHQLGREWTLIVDSPEAGACLSAWELAEAQALSDLDRRFEVIWSFDPAVVATATDAARSLLAGVAPAVAERIPQTRRSGGPEAVIGFGAELASRAYGYLASDPSRRPARKQRR